MRYVFDTNAFSQIFNHYYRECFPSLWKKFAPLAEGGVITSTREVRREIEDCPIASLTKWTEDHRDLFPTPPPTADEGQLVVQIFRVRHFQQVIEKKKLLTGRKNADPFIIARAKVLRGTVVTMEKFKPHAVKIPNICQYFKVSCTSLEGFTEQEDWVF